MRTGDSELMQDEMLLKPVMEKQRWRKGRWRGSYLSCAASLLS